MSEFTQAVEAAEATQAAAVMSRRAFLAVTGASVLSACSREPAPDQEFPPVPDCHETPVTVEKVRKLGPESVGLTKELPWDMPGVEKRPDGGLHVTPIQTAVYNKDTNTYEPIQPHNTAFRVDGKNPLMVAAVVSATDRFSLALSETLPLIHDDFVIPGKGVRVTCSATEAVVETWDGEHQEPAKQTIPLARSGNDHSIALERSNETTLKVGDRSVRLPHLSGEHLWFGVSAQGGPADVSRFSVAAPRGELLLRDMTTLHVTPCPGGLSSTAARRRSGFRVGTAVSLGPLLDDPTYAALLAANFNEWTTENAGKPQFTQREEGKFTLHEARQIAVSARRHGARARLHGVMPNRSYPEWMAKIPPDRAEEVLDRHVRTLVGGLPEYDAFDVVNEPLDGWGWQQTPFIRAMGGPRMIEVAMRAAYEAKQKANARAELWLNENAMDKAGAYDEHRFMTLFNIMRDLRRKGIEVDGLGFEGHVYQRPRDLMSPTDLRRRIRMLRAEGFKARVSEMDVVPYSGAQKHTPSPEELRGQAEHFRDIGRVCIEEGADFSLWGIGGKYVSTAGMGPDGKLTYASHLPWGDHMEELLPYSALQQAFR